MYVCRSQILEAITVLQPKFIIMISFSQILKLDMLCIHSQVTSIVILHSASLLQEFNGCSVAGV